jgi:1-deoxy-D-xylulose-5-phosphate reductoisomerase
MKGAIAYALSYPQRLPLQQPLPQFNASQTLSFQEPDLTKFPCLAMAFQACEIGGTLPAVLNAANEIAVHGFLNQEIAFLDIMPVIRQTMDQHSVVADPGLSEILAADQWARGYARDVIEELIKN